ncbi:MAG TPA: glycosyltransferase [Aquabacterium sp.]|nr:glycosyltransferase [Aquabacterium sp.]HQC97882.1 glycosyltransferase [Aquabacterium sp.]
MFSIIIPTWNNLPYLQLAVDSIRRHSAQPQEVLVHVNDGSDGTLDWVRAQGLQHTHSPANVGICLAFNEVASRASARYFVYLNDDMVVSPGWDERLLRRIQALPTELFMVSGTMVEPLASGNACVVVRDFGDTVDAFREADLLRALPGLVREDWAGATWPPTVVHRDRWFRVGGYASEFSPGMSSDNDFAMKLWHAGCRHFIGVGDALVYHFQCKSTGKVVKNDGRRQFLAKWGMGQRTFDRHFLRRGAPLPAGDGRVPEPIDAPALRWALRKDRLKRTLRG